MPRELDSSIFRKDQSWLRLAVGAWALLLIVLVARLVVSHQVHSVYPIFSDAARCWHAGQEMYWPYHPDTGLNVYRYSPSVALLFVPFSFLSDRVGSMLWLALNGAVLLAALVWWMRAGLPRALAIKEKAILSLIVLIFAAGNLHNGQTNVAVIAMLLVAATAVCTDFWMLAAVCLAAATVIKVYPLAFGLLLVLAYPRKLGWRLAGSLVIAAALPFLFQPAEYVVRQYRHWGELMVLDDRKQIPISLCYRDLWLFVRLWNLPVSPFVYTLFQGAGALAVAIACFLARRAGWSRQNLATFCLGLGSIWMMTLGPATESPTYLILAPTLAWALVDLFTRSANKTAKFFCVLSAACLILAQASAAFAGEAKHWFMALHPAGALVLLPAVVLQGLETSRRVESASVVDAKPMASAA